MVAGLRKDPSNQRHGKSERNYKRNVGRDRYSPLCPYRSVCNWMAQTIRHLSTGSPRLMHRLDEVG